MTFASTRARFTFLIFVAELVFATLVAVAFLAMRQAEFEDADVAMTQSLMRDMVAIADAGNESALVRTIEARAISDSSDILLLVDAEGKTLAGDLDAWPESLMRTSAPAHRAAIRTEPDAKPEYYIVATEGLSGGQHLLAGRRLGRSFNAWLLLERATLMALLLAVPLAALIAFLVARTIERRLLLITDVTEAYAGDSMDVRCAIDGSGDAFDRLGRSVNAMLDRISSLVAELRLVTDGLAHDLRSPLTRLRNQVDRALASGSEDDLRAAVVAASEESEHLLATLGTVLEISRAEAGFGRTYFEPVDLAEIATDLAEIYQPVAEEEGRDFVSTVGRPAVVSGQADLLARALGNLIENALKYGEGEIGLSLNVTRQDAVIRVADAGPGIPPDQLEEALRRFGRLDHGGGKDGAGLGLALVDSITRMHGGDLSMAGGPGDFCVQLRFPLIDPQARSPRSAF